MHPLARRLLCGCMVLTLVLSDLSVGIGPLTCNYMLEAMVTVFSCLSVGVCFSFFGLYATTDVCTYVSARFLWVVVFYD